MNEALVSNWNSVVGEDDVVFVLGDVAMGKIHESLQYVSRLNGDKFLVPGNHDRCWFGNHDKKKSKSEWEKDYVDAGFAGVLCNGVDKDMGVHDISWHFEKDFDEVIACHFPFSDDGKYDDRYLTYRPADNGEILLHGHIHDAWRVNGRMINVGTDVWEYHPVSIQVIEHVMEHGDNVCQGCFASDANYVQNPFVRNVYNTVRYEFICPNCFKNKCEDI